ncbi:hypothetical protein-signal peptide and transmembrane prediction [hydrothermal vent metagenome]|uniref:Phosphatidic acid phosphatase type 2/haloperoxidase domain-containing protein n=1 Tax=hydrothermal vent metagenome TaxID=652676 RepID=A0A1W1BB58_9ZZZZ
MKKFVVVLVVCIGITVFADSKNVYHAIQNDYKNFYSTDSLYKMGIVFIVGGVAANSNIDQYLQNEYQNNLRNTTTDNISKTMKSFGEGRYTIPIALLATSLQYIKPESSVGKWGEYVSRSYFVGAPALLVMQRVTGGSRPGERDYNSRWKPFKDNNGVSGHAFMGAVPFLVIANMNQENPYIKYTAIIASFFTAWSRINDNAHYTSQAFLGWYMAYQSVHSVCGKDLKNKYAIVPFQKNDIYGLNIIYRW